jgi:hypothetical protein
MGNDVQLSSAKYGQPSHNTLPYQPLWSITSYVATI